MKIKVLLFCIILSSCSSVKNNKNNKNNKKIENDLKRLNFKGNVASSRSWCYKAVSLSNSIEKGEIVYELPYAINHHYFFDKNGHEYKYVLLGGKKDTLWHFKSHYNKLAKKNESISVSIGLGTSYHFYKYDNDYNCIEELTKDENGENSNLKQFVYNKEKNSIIEKHYIFEDGKLKFIDYSESETIAIVDGEKERAIYYDTNDKITFKIISYFDDKKNYIKSESYNSKGYQSDETTMKYDESGNRIERIERDLDTKHYNFNLSKFDENNNVIKSEEYNSIHEGKRNIWTFTYELNSKKDWVKQVVFKNEIPTYIIEREIEYY